MKGAYHFPSFLNLHFPCVNNLSDNHAAYIYIPVPYLKLKLHFNQRKLNQPDTTPAQLQHAD